MEAGHAFNFCGNNRQSRKRRNCGYFAHECLVSNLGSRMQLDLEAMSHGARLSSRQYNGFELGNNASSRLPFSTGIATDGSWNAILMSSPPQQPLSSSLRSSSNSSHTLNGGQGRNSNKRKSTMDSYLASSTHACGTGDTRFRRFTQCHRAFPFETPLNSLCDEFGVRRDGQGAYHSIRTSVLPISFHDGLNASRTQDSYYSSSILQNERGLRRVLPRSDTMNLSIGNMDVGWPEPLPLRQDSALSASGSWQGIGTYLQESCMQSGFFETMRILNTSIVGSGLRQGEALAMIRAAPVNTRPHQSPCRTVRPACFHSLISESPSPNHLALNPYASLGSINGHLPSFPSVQLSNRYMNMHTMRGLPAPELTPVMSALMAGTPRVFGDLPSVSTPGQVASRYTEANRTSFLRQVTVQGPRILQSDRVNNQQYFSSHHDSSNQYLSYEWGDAHDEHSDMRLDVDNMSYEELLALQERIGNVNTGLDEANIQNYLKVTIHACSDMAMVVESEDSKCSICQEEYVEGDKLGEVQCGHAYHNDCIKQWLLIRNQCPICKSAAS